MAIVRLETDGLYKEFKVLVNKIFNKNGFTTEIDFDNENSLDFLATLDNTSCFVEIKLYRNRNPNLDLLKSACLKLLSEKKEASQTKLILVVSCYVIPSLKHEIFKEFGVTVWDIKTLFALSYDFDRLYYELDSILVKALKITLEEYSTPDDAFKNQIIPSLIEARAEFKRQPLQDKGIKLCHQLKSIKPGKEEAKRYEEKCIEILKYLFDNETDLTLWEPQNSTDDGLNRFDLLCRIISFNNSFWTELSEDFHTRYVVFEFKNYTEAIKQAQIFTTEKYLFLTALRSVSFIIATVGADENAIKAAKGALKEAGKLIVILANQDICEMLTLKDKGDDPSIVLRNKIDEMLTKLNR